MKTCKNIMNISKLKLMLVLMIVVFFEGFMDLKKPSLNLVVGWIFGYVNLSRHDLFVVSLLRLIIPQIAILFLWGDFIHENLVKNYQLIFSRTRKTHSVLNKFFSQLLINVTITTILMEMLIVLLYMLKGYKVSNPVDLFLDLSIYCIYINGLLVFVNGLSLGVNCIYGVIIGLTLQIISFEVDYNILQGDMAVRPKIYYICPTSPIMFIENIGINLRSKIIWCLGLVGLTAIFYIVTCICTKRKEFI